MGSKRKTSPVLFPFLPSGTLLGWTSLKPGQSDNSSVFGIESNITWKEAFILEGPLEIIAFSRGPSAAVFELKGPGGASYPVTAEAMVKALRAFPVHKGVIAGRWTFKRQGVNYRLVPVLDDHEELDP